METKYAAPFSQLHHPLYLLHPPDLSSSRAFLSPPSVLPSFIVFVIIIYYQHIIIMKKLINPDHLAYCCCHACFVSVDKKSAQAGLTFDSIYTIYKSFSRIL